MHHLVEHTELADEEGLTLIADVHPRGTILHFHLQKSDVFCIFNLKFSPCLPGRGKGGVARGKTVTVDNCVIRSRLRGGAPRKGKDPDPCAAAGGRVPREGLFQYVKGRSGRRPMWILKAGRRGMGGWQLREVFATYRFCECKRFTTYQFCECERFCHLSVVRLREALPPIGCASAKIRCKIAFVNSCGKLFS